MSITITGIGVVIPVRNEEELLPRALAALDATREHLVAALGAAAPWVRVVVVLDNCTDRSAAIARSWDGIETLTVTHGAVGAARRAGISLLLDTPDDAASVWIANTDADSQVPADWLLRQWEFAADGVDLMVGTVRPDFDDLSDAQRRQWLATHTPGHANGHVHGANLGFRADRYLAAGGFARVPEHEDVFLVAALKEAGARFVATDNCCVLTSGRPYGRTPGGYASHLRERLVLEPFPASVAVGVDSVEDGPAHTDLGETISTGAQT